MRYILGIMNSTFIEKYYETINPERGEALAQIKKKHVEQLPIRNIDFSNQSDKARHDKIAELVERMLELHQRLIETKIPTSNQMIQRQIDATDQQINALVYELYDLTEDEITIVEEGDNG